jgi:hypothetical protein
MGIPKEILEVCRRGVKHPQAAEAARAVVPERRRLAKDRHVRPVARVGP